MASERVERTGVKVDQQQDDEIRGTKRSVEPESVPEVRIYTCRLTSSASRYECCLRCSYICDAYYFSENRSQFLTPQRRTF
jgi:hypothetical protein